MVWRRLPVYFPNLSLKLMPLPEDQRKLWDTSGYVTQLVFKTTPRTNKIEIKRLLEKLYGVTVEKVNTINYLGKKKAGSRGPIRKPDWKKAYVELAVPADKQPAP